MICPPEHKHHRTSTCYQEHRCRCGPCREQRNARSRRRYAELNALSMLRTSCDVCSGPVVQPRATCEPCVEACMELWREEHAA